VKKEVARKKGEGVGPASKLDVAGKKRNTLPANRAPSKHSKDMRRFDEFFARSELLSKPLHQWSVVEMDKIWGKLDDKFKRIFE